MLQGKYIFTDGDQFEGYSPNRLTGNMRDRSRNGVCGVSIWRSGSFRARGSDIFGETVDPLLSAPSRLVPKGRHHGFRPPSGLSKQ